MRAIGWLPFLGLLLAAAAGSGAQTAEMRAAPPPGVVDIASCVSPQALRFESGDVNAVLDDGDRDAVAAAMAERYPMLQRDGFAPAHIVLWQKKGGELLFVSLKSREDAPGEMCFTATFAAARFEFTPHLLMKYFFGSLRA